MTPGEIKQAYEEIKRHLGNAQRHRQVDEWEEMRGEAETATILFRRVRAEAGDPMGMLDGIRMAMTSFGYGDEECDAMLSHSPASMKKAKKSKDHKDKQAVKPAYVQPHYHVPPGKLNGFPEAVPVKKKGGRKRWVDKKAKRIYEWDYENGRVEGWDKTGKKHQGEFDPNDGKQTKPPDPTKQPITPEIARPMTNKNENYALAWYSVDDETLVDEVTLQLSTDDVRKWFFLPADDPAIFCYDVTASQRKCLLPLIGDANIDLNEYDYQLEGRAVEE